MADFRVQKVPIAKLVSRGNVRAHLIEEEQVALAQSIAQNGIRMPLIGHEEGNEVVVVDGHRRWDAAKRAELAEVPMLISDHAPTPAERLTLALIANTQQKGLKPAEHGRGLNELMQVTGWSSAELSVKFGGPSAGHISKLLSLVILPRAVQDLIDAGRIPMSSGYEIAKIADATEREQLVQEVLSGLTRDKVVERAKAIGAVPKRRKPRQMRRERVVIALGQGRSLTLSAPALGVESVVAWLTELAQRISGLAVNGRSLPEIVKALSESAA